MAEVFLFTSPGAPSVFYGDELGMDGNSEFLLRGPMAWGKPKSDERELFRKLIALRKENEAIMVGTFRELLRMKMDYISTSEAWNGKTVTVARREKL